MKSWVLLIVAVVLVCAAMQTHAAPPKRSDIPADADWAFHVDCDALRQTYLGQFLLYQLNKPEMKSNMVAFQTIFSFDLCTQLHGFTIYCEKPTVDDSIVLVYADFDPKRMAALLMSNETAVATTTKNGTVYHWIDRTKYPTGEDVPHNFLAMEKSLLIVGHQMATVKWAMAVVKGQSPNLSSTNALSELTPADVLTFVQAAARKVDFGASNPNADLLKMARHITLQASESDQKLSAFLTLELEDEATAKQTASVAQGLIAILSLQKQNTNLTRLANYFAVKQDATSVTTTLTGPAADFVAALKTYFAKPNDPAVTSK